jgi:internalin A
MTFMVRQKYVNLSRLMVVVAFSAIGLSSCGSISSLSFPQMRWRNKTFGDWCREKDSLSPETKRTVEVLLQEAGTTKCDAANQKLSSLTELSLNSYISDIKPLQSFTKLTKLDLSSNSITDIRPLESLVVLHSQYSYEYYLINKVALYS